MKPSMTPRQEFEQAYGQVWDTAQLTKDFRVKSFMSPFAFVERRSDGRKGSLKFSHRPRFYHSFSLTD